MKTECPKCGSQSAWYEKTYCDLILRCRCGVAKVVFSTLGVAEIVHSDAGDEVKLPRPGSNLRKTLLVLQVQPESNSAEITQRLRELGETFTVSDVASYLTILRSKGLVCTTVVRRGVVGGSTWVLTETAVKLLG